MQKSSGPTMAVYPPKDATDERIAEIAEKFFPYAERIRVEGWPSLPFDINDQTVPSREKMVHWLVACNKWLYENAGPGWEFLPVSTRVHAPHRTVN